MPAEWQTEVAARTELERLRDEIEEVDQRLLAALAERVALAQRVGELKRRAGLPLLDASREAAVIRRAAELGREAALPEEDVRALFWQVVGLCRRAQTEPPRR